MKRSITVIGIHLFVAAATVCGLCAAGHAAAGASPVAGSEVASFGGESFDGRLFAPYGTGMTFASKQEGNVLPQDTAPKPDSTLSTGTTSTGGGLLNWAYDSFIDGASITLGYGIRRSSFTFQRKSDGATGTIVDRDYPAYFLIYSTKPSFFENSRFGYTFMVKLSTFDMEQQVASGALIGGTPVDVHTDLEGIIGYAVPALYYQWGEHRATGTFLRTGAGLGLATTTYSGTIELRSPSGSEQVSVRDQSFSLHLAWTVFLEAKWRHWGGYLSVMRAQLPGDTYDTVFEDVSLYLGYQFFF